MANVMLSSGGSTDRPSKPFKERIIQLRKKYDLVLLDAVALLSGEHKHLAGQQQSSANALKTSLLSRIEAFNLECDEIYKDIHQRKMRLLVRDEGPSTSEEIQKEVQAVGQISQLIGDFKYFLEIGESPNKD